ncbi:nucleoside monophosphate kinase [Candidatus Kaiserbacteria bacterium]|nr:nucleoside monophosphate kinase [Candidatus Kaiserbacteria bacterium]
MMNPVTVLFFGPQGAGKGTQVKLLIEALKKRSEHDVIHIDMGQLLRNMVATGSYSGKLTAEVIEVGKRMPDFMPTYLTIDALVKNFTGGEHIIADGLARGPDQTRGWDDAMQFYKRADYSIISLELSEAGSIERLVKRGRNDDTEAAIKQRLGWHKAEVEPQLELMASRGRTVHRINGDQSIEAVHADVMKALGL